MEYQCQYATIDISISISLCTGAFGTSICKKAGICKDTTSYQIKLLAADLTFLLILVCFNI